jgi:hypothetical protein
MTQMLKPIRAKVKRLILIVGLAVLLIGPLPPAVRAGDCPASPAEVC